MFIARFSNPLRYFVVNLTLLCSLFPSRLVVHNSFIRDSSSNNKYRKSLQRCFLVNLYTILFHFEVAVVVCERYFQELPSTSSEVRTSGWLSFWSHSGVLLRNVCSSAISICVAACRVLRQVPWAVANISHCLQEDSAEIPGVPKRVEWFREQIF